MRSNATDLSSRRRSGTNRGSASYETRLRTLGVQFLDEADRSVSIILEAPERWNILEADVRRYLMTHFPYAIYYRISFEPVRILAFKHHSRRPDYWRYRMSEE